MPTPIANAGYYGATANLPGDPGPPEPTPLPGALAWDPSTYGNVGAGAGFNAGGAAGEISITDLLNLFTRMDPNMGYLTPSLDINAGDYPSPGGPERQPSFLARMFGRTAPGAIINIIKKMRDASGETWKENAAFGGTTSPRTGFTRGQPVGGSGGFQQMHPDEYTQATFGGLTPTGFRDPRGSSAFDSHAANLQLMSSQARAGNPNVAGPDVRNRFNPVLGAGHVNDQGFIERTAGGVNPAAQWGDWTAADQVADHARIRAQQLERSQNPFAFLLPPPAPRPYPISQPPQIPIGV